MTGERGRALVVVGTRPEAIKMAPVVKALAAYADTVETRLALTGQHDELVDNVLAAFGMKPDWDLGIMREGQSPSEVGRECLRGIEEVVREWHPDLVLVGPRVSIEDTGQGQLAHRLGQAHRDLQPALWRHGAQEFVVAGVRGG